MRSDINNMANKKKNTQRIKQWIFRFCCSGSAVFYTILFFSLWSHLIPGTVCVYFPISTKYFLSRRRGDVFCDRQTTKASKPKSDDIYVREYFCLATNLIYSWMLLLFDIYAKKKLITFDKLIELLLSFLLSTPTTFSTIPSIFPLFVRNQTPSSESLYDI